MFWISCNLHISSVKGKDTSILYLTLIWPISGSGRDLKCLQIARALIQSMYDHMTLKNGITQHHEGVTPNLSHF